MKAITGIELFTKQTKVEDYHFSNREVLEELCRDSVSVSFLASLAPGYPCPKSESECGTELFLTLLNTRVHQHQKDQLCILRSTNLAGQCCSAAGPHARCSKRCPTFFFCKSSGVFSVSSLRSCTCSLPAAWALWSVPVIECSCLALHVTASLLELSAFCFHRTYLLGSVPGSCFMLGIFKQAFIQLGTCF